MKKSIALTAALAATAVLGLGAGPATAGGDHRGDDDYDLTIPLTERVSDELLDGDNGVAATGAAEKWVDDGRIVLSFPVRGDDKAKYRGGDGTHGAWRLGGGIAFTGAGPDVSWSAFKLGGDKGIVTAVVDGDRVAVLTVADRDWGGHHRGGGHSDDDAWLELTAAGAASLNRAADGSPFEAGDAFAGGKDCR